VNSIKEKRKADNLFISKADKGNVVTILNKNEYIQKVNTFISDNNIQKLKDDPTQMFQNNIKHSINRTNAILTDKQKRYIKMIKPSAPLLRGLPKIHKENCPIRPLINYQNAPAYKLAKTLEKVIRSNFKFNNNIMLKNSIDLVSKIKDLEIPMNTKLVSFDIKNLYTNIPIKETINILKNNLKVQNHLEEEKIKEIVYLTDLVLQQNYFQFENEFYIQEEGLPMGSPLSGLIADIFLDHIEHTHILSEDNRFKHNLVYYYRYVDDIICLYKGNERQIDIFKNYLNNLHQKLQFSSEIESDMKINYLDLTISNLNNKHNFKIYRKSTYSDLVIPASSNHPHSQKMAAFNTMIHRLHQVPLSRENFEIELNTIRYIAQTNGYNPNILDRILKKYNKKQNKEIKDKPIYIPFNFTGKDCYKIQKIFVSHGYQLAFKTTNNLEALLKESKLTSTTNDDDKFQKSGVYKLKCNDCDSFYIGQTGRSFQDRYKEHIKAITNKSHSNFADHLINENHSYSDCNQDLEILHICKKSHLMTTLENLEIYKNTKKNPNLLLNEKSIYNINPLFEQLLNL
jgi:hypothetical protein